MPNNQTKINSEDSISKVVAEKIREEIISGKLKPGDKLKEAFLSNQMQVSRTPIREAFRVLQSEGFLTYNPNCGVMVATLGVDDVSHLYEIRSVLEQISARYAALHISKEQLQELVSINEEIKNFDSLNPQRSSDLDLQFHNLIALASQNQILIDCLSVIFMKTAMVLRFIPFKKERIANTYKEHEDIILALTSGDSGLAQKYMEIHFYNSTKSLIRKAIDFNQNREN